MKTRNNNEKLISTNTRWNLFWAEMLTLFDLFLRN